MTNAAVARRFPVLDLAFCDSDLVRDIAFINSDGDQFLNMAAFGLRFCSQLNAAAPIGLTSSSLIDENAIVAICGFSAIAYLHHSSEFLSICGHHEHLASLKSFASWLAIMAIDFRDSIGFEVDNVARSAVGKVLGMGSLATQAMEFLQYDSQVKDLLAKGLNYENRQLIAMFCAAPLFGEYYGDEFIPTTLSNDAVSGFLYIASYNSSKSLSAFDWLMKIKAEFLDEKLLFSW